MTQRTIKSAPDGKPKPKKRKKTRVSYHRRPDDMQLDRWQFGLRKQFGEENEFHITHTDEQALASEYIVWNPATKNAYTVNVRANLPRRGLPPENTITFAGNSCSCQDFKTNRLGICKHISAALRHIGKKEAPKRRLPLLQGHRIP